MDIFIEAVKILAQDILLFGVISFVGLLACIWLVCGSKPLKKWFSVSMRLYWSKLNTTMRGFAFVFSIILLYSVGASFRAAADEWMSDKPARHMGLKDLWLLTDYPYAKEKHRNPNDVENIVEKAYKKDARKHTDKALKLYAMAELVEHAEEAAPLKTKTKLGCRLKTYSTQGKNLEQVNKNCGPAEVINNEYYEAIEEVSLYYQFIKHREIVRANSIANKYDSASSQANLVINFMRLTAFLSFLLAIAALLAITRKMLVCLFRIKSKAWLPAIRLGWTAGILILSLLTYLGAAAAWQALEIKNNKTIFRHYFVNGSAEVSEAATNKVIADINKDLHELGLMIGVK